MHIARPAVFTVQSAPILVFACTCTWLMVCLRGSVSCSTCHHSCCLLSACYTKCKVSSSIACIHCNKGQHADICRPLPLLLCISC
jgi:hypothetical protein